MDNLRDTLIAIVAMCICAACTQGGKESPKVVSSSVAPLPPFTSSWQTVPGPVWEHDGIRARRAAEIQNGVLKNYQLEYSDVKSGKGTGAKVYQPQNGRLLEDITYIEGGFTAEIYDKDGQPHTIGYANGMIIAYY